MDRPVDALLSTVGIAFVIAIITAAGLDSLLAIGPLLFLAAVLHNGVGYRSGGWGCRLIDSTSSPAGRSRSGWGCRTVDWRRVSRRKWEGSATVSLAPAVISSRMNVTGSALANLVAQAAGIPRQAPALKVEPRAIAAT